MKKILIIVGLIAVVGIVILIISFFQEREFPVYKNGMAVITLGIEQHLNNPEVVNGMTVTDAGEEGGDIASIRLEGDIEGDKIYVDTLLRPGNFVIPAETPTITISKQKRCKILSGTYEEKRGNTTYTITFENVKLYP